MEIQSICVTVDQNDSTTLGVFRITNVSTTPQSSKLEQKIYNDVCAEEFFGETHHDVEDSVRNFMRDYILKNHHKVSLIVVK